MTQLLFATYAYPPLFYPRSLQISLLARELYRENNLTIIAANFGKTSEALLPLCAPCPTIRVGETGLAKCIRRMKGDRFKRFLLPDDMYLNLRAFRTQMDRQNWNDTRLVTFGQPMSMHLLGLHYKKRFPKIRWSAHFSDPWTHEGYSRSTGLAQILNKCYEEAVYKTADRLIFTSPETIDHTLSGPYMPYKEKAVFVPHGFDPALYPAFSRAINGSIRIGYFGTFYGERQPHGLFAAMHLLQKQNPEILNNVQFCFFGAGDGKAYAPLTKGLQPHLEFSQGVDFISSLQISSGMDGLLVIDAPAKTSVFFPSKLADYIGANRPIIGITPVAGTSANILRDLNMDVADPARPGDIARALTVFIEGIKANDLHMNQEKRLRYRSDNVAREFINAIY